jgi:hypothetical protein
MIVIVLMDSFRFREKRERSLNYWGLAVVHQSKAGDDDDAVEI